MTPLVCRMTFAAIGLTRAEAAKAFNRDLRTVDRWLDRCGDGPPDHIALALTEIREGRLDIKNWQAVRSFVGRCYSRRDGDRYERRP